MPIIVGDTSKSSFGTTSSVSFSHTVATGENLLVVLSSTHTGGSGRVINSITFNGDALTKIGHKEGAGSGRVEIWYRVNPDVTTANVVITYATSVDEGAAGAISAKSAAPTPLRNYTTENGVAVPSITLDALGGGLAVDCMYHKTSTDTTPSASGQVELFDRNNGNATQSVGSYKLVPSSGDTTMSWTVSADHCHIVAVFDPTLAGNYGYIIG